MKRHLRENIKPRVTSHFAECATSVHGRSKGKRTHVAMSPAMCWDMEAKPHALQFLLRVSTIRALNSQVRILWYALNRSVGCSNSQTICDGGEKISIPPAGNQILQCST
jgi:hypothetical protein